MSAVFEIDKKMLLQNSNDRNSSGNKAQRNTTHNIVFAIDQHLYLQKFARGK